MHSYGQAFQTACGFRKSVLISVLHNKKEAGSIEPASFLWTNGLFVASVAVLVFLAASAGAGVVTPHFFLHADG